MKKSIVKTLTRLLALVLLLSFALLIAASCTTEGNDEGGEGTNTNPFTKDNEEIEKADATRSQIKVYNYNGGYGSGWLNVLKARFEAEYANVSFEEGKLGVQVIIDNQKSGNVDMETILASSTDEVFFAELMPMQGLIRKGLLKDITSWMTEPLTEYGETRSIEDKMDDQEKAWYSANGAYYGIPHYESFWGITYNVDLFDQNLLYYSTNLDNGNDGFIKTPNETKSAGPDGQFGTYDDGLPATYDQFYALCERMVLLGITPFSFPGKYQTYINACVASNLMASYEGAEGTMLFYTQDGVADSIVSSIDANGVPTLTSATVTPATGYLAYQQAGCYYGLTFLNKIISEGWYTKDSFKNTQSQLAAQAEFLFTDFVPGTERVAFLCDGCWWQTEAQAIFSEMSETYNNADQGSRNFAWLPLPKATEDKIGTKGAICDSNWSACFVSAKADPAKDELYKTFVRYLNTDVSLREFTVVTNTTKGLDYELTAEDYAKLTTFGKSIWDASRKENDVIRSYSDSKIFVNNSGTFFWGDQWQSTIGSKGTFNTPSTAMRDSDITGKDYFLGLAVYWSASEWQRRFGAYFD